ncbi:chemotaxis protein CheY [Achromatium sp. WMS3]|nr:chemotaxis protein CheY [Achromatium sp. WMS2]KOR30049.1 chemotaxis protein CheY [Achromatium sp. WMS3]
MAVSKVLVCDDSNTDLTNLKTIVEGAGYTVITASSGVEALSCAKAEQPDVILLDIIMPEMDGFEACRKLTNDPETKHIPIVFVTSKSQKADRVWGQMQGAKDLISKPCAEDQVLAKLKEL